jgi:prepilin-type N-terminal cleavage/methylation domain-containing protein
MKKHRAFTLLEVLVTLGIFAVMLVVLINFYVSTNSQFAYEREYVTVARGTDDIIDTVGDHVRPANQVLASYAFATGIRQSTTTSLVLSIPSITSNGQIIIGSYDYVAFYSSGTKAYRLIEAAAGSARRSGTRLLSENVSTITFAYDSSDFTQVRAVTVSASSSGTAKGQPLTHALSQELYLRNAP